MSESNIPEAARSVHLWYDIPKKAKSVQNTVVVRESQKGTYFCVIQFSIGYMGIQELPDGTKHIIFSVWDSKDDEDPQKDNKAQALYAGEGVVVSRFGGEGVGLKCMRPYDWHLDEDCTLRVSASKEDEHGCTIFKGDYFDQRMNSWFHIATLKSNSDSQIGNCACFVEDFRRDGLSYNQSRHAYFHSCCFCVDNDTCYCFKAHFTADGSSPTNINAGKCKSNEKEVFFLATGGNVVNDHCKLSSTISLNE